MSRSLPLRVRRTCFAAIVAAFAANAASALDVSISELGTSSSIYVVDIRGVPPPRPAEIPALPRWTIAFAGTWTTLVATMQSRRRRRPAFRGQP